MSGAPADFLGREAEPGNSRALTHGTKSERKIAPLRQRHLEKTKRKFPDLDDERAVLLAELLAKVDLAMAYVDRKGIIRSDRTGAVWPVVIQAEKWEARAMALLKEIAAENKQANTFDLATEFTKLHEAELAAGMEEGDE